MENFDNIIRGHEENTSTVRSLESGNTLVDDIMTIQMQAASSVLGGDETIIGVTTGGSESPKVTSPNEGESDDISSDPGCLRVSELEVSLVEARNMLIKIIKERDHYRVEHRRVKVERDRLMCMFHAFQGTQFCL